MIAKSSKLYSVIHQKCPRCHEGDMFENSTFSVHFAKMHKNCPHCNLDFVREPSYYFGAMYFSYAIQVAVITAVYLALEFTIQPGTWTYVAWMIAAILLIVPFNYRVSRVMWINLFISYRKTDDLVANTGK